MTGIYRRVVLVIAVDH